MWRYGAFPKYVPVHVRRERARSELEKLERAGRKLDPVEVDGRRIAASFWGKAWCAHLESYSDYANRLPRGRAYLRSGAVVDLRIGAGRVDAIVAGSAVYEVSIEVRRLPAQRFKRIAAHCAGQ